MGWIVSIIGIVLLLSILISIIYSWKLWFLLKKLYLQKENKKLKYFTLNARLIFLKTLFINPFPNYIEFARLLFKTRISLSISLILFMVYAFLMLNYQNPVV